ncbi:regulatory protein GemA [Palleronia caenipelagi]|uniref:Regulatory protein GemA n=1 Tax=Palleronia caenipelagi TaxID=2489174 RepID=A0A547Q853_9RHOB|nr:regulatory protein GemA [Palleronia caenipelagi]TRD22543.1 regulatory protein GemA [Palleronia caenipelagi]
MLSNKQKAVLHIAKTKLNLNDAAYRCVLVELAGVTSATEMDQDGFNTVMGYFEWCGFAPMTAKGQDYGTRPGMASFAQLELIRTIWREYTHGNYGGEAELNKWLFRTFKLSSLRFMTKSQAQKAITALKAMKARAA